jgi:hypothetical protein
MGSSAGAAWGVGSTPAVWAAASSLLGGFAHMLQLLLLHATTISRGARAYTSMRARTHTCTYALTHTQHTRARAHIHTHCWCVLVAGVGSLPTGALGVGSCPATALGVGSLPGAAPGVGSMAPAAHVGQERPREANVADMVRTAHLQSARPRRPGSLAHMAAGMERAAVAATRQTLSCMLPPRRRRCA